MKYTITRILSIMVITLTLVGCGTRTDTASPNETSEVRPQETVISEENTGTADTEKTVDTGDTANTADKEETADTKNSAAQQGTVISEEEAKAIALKDAGLTEEVSGIRVKLETDDGVQEYEVDFYAGYKEYDYDIDAQTGEIRSKDMDIDDDFNKTKSVKTAVTEEEVKKIVLEKVPQAAEKDIRMHLDYDDGRTIYEGSVVSNGVEYDFEIDVDSGKILEWEEEH